MSHETWIELTGYDCPLVVVLVHYSDERSYGFCSRGQNDLTAEKIKTKYLHTSNDRHMKSDSFISSCHLLPPLVWGLWMWSSWDVSVRWSTSSLSSPKLTRWPWRRGMTSSRRWEDCETVTVDAHVRLDGASTNVTKILQRVLKVNGSVGHTWAPQNVCVFSQPQVSRTWRATGHQGKKNIVPITEFTVLFLTFTDAVLQRQPLHGNLCPVASQAGRPFITSEALGDHTRSEGHTDQNMTRIKLEPVAFQWAENIYRCQQKVKTSCPVFDTLVDVWVSFLDASIFGHASNQSVQATQPWLPYHDFSCHSSLSIHLTRVAILCAAPFWCTSAW